MFALLYDPVREIKLAKKQNYARILLYLVAAALFETVGLLFFAWNFFPDRFSNDLLVMSIFGVLAGLILAHLVVAFFFSLALHVLDGKAGYYEGLSALVLAFVAPAVAIFFAGALSFVPFGIFLSILLLMYGCVLGASTLFRSAKEFFEIDYAGVLVGFLITKFVLAGAVVGFILL